MSPSGPHALCAVPVRPRGPALTRTPAVPGRWQEPRHCRPSAGGGREVLTARCLPGRRGPGRGDGARPESTGGVTSSAVPAPRAVQCDLNAALQEVRSNHAHFCSRSSVEPWPEWPMPLSPSTSFPCGPSALLLSLSP